MSVKKSVNPSTDRPKKKPENSIYIEVGKRLSEFRKKAGFTQAQLAKCIGKSRQQYISWEKGHAKIMLHDIYDIAPYLRKTPNEILEP